MKSICNHYITGHKIIKFTKTMTHSLKIALKDMFSILSQNQLKMVTYTSLMVVNSTV